MYIHKHFEKFLQEIFSKLTFQDMKWLNPQSFSLL